MKKWIKQGFLLIMLVFILFHLIAVLNADYAVEEHAAKWVKGYEDTGSGNLVTAIYLDYRLMDTFIEACILFAAVGGIIFMSKKDQDVT